MIATQREGQVERPDSANNFLNSLSIINDVETAAISFLNELHPSGCPLFPVQFASGIFVCPALASLASESKKKK